MLVAFNFALRVRRRPRLAGLEATLRPAHSRSMAYYTVRRPRSGPGPAWPAAGGGPAAAAGRGKVAACAGVDASLSLNGAGVRGVAAAAAAGRPAGRPAGVAAAGRPGRAALASGGAGEAAAAAAEAGGPLGSISESSSAVGGRWPGPGPVTSGSGGSSGSGSCRPRDPSAGGAPPEKFNERGLWDDRPGPSIA
jgi:hypothetical protein